MASGTLSTRPPAENSPIAGRYEEFIQTRLEHTRRQVRLVDVGSGVVLLAAASLFFFLAVAVADHWLFPHGLNFAVRLILWAVWVGVAVWFAWRSVAPSVMHRINPVYAAQTIEQGRPTLKNSLINFLLLRAHPEGVAPVVYRAMEHRAASDLSHVPVEHAVDHRRLVHLCYVLAAAVVLFALYLAFSPKNPLVSAARVIWPWASLPAPTRVHIEDVQPGDAVVFQGERQEITAHVSGLRNGEEVALLISTADAQLVDDRIAMNRTGDDDRYACTLPQGDGGMQQTTTYRITAGDAATQQFKLDVRIAPTITVDRVDYHVPPYTLDSGMRDHSVKGQGDIKGLEGTRVTIHAAANMEIKDAYVDLGGSRRISMKHDGKRATGEFTLALDPEQNWKPQCDYYEIRFNDLDGHLSQHPVKYHIDVDRDYPPKIEIVEPTQETVAVAAGGKLRIRVHATDDFGLRRVTLHAERNGNPLDLPVLMDRVPPEKAWDKPFDGDYDFVPAAFHLLKGDKVTYWAEVEDNKEPQHNRSETPKRTITIVDDQEAQQGQPNEKQRGEGDGQKGEGQPQQGQNGKGTDQQGAGQPGNDSHDASKGEPSSDKNQTGKGDVSKSPDSKQGGKGDPSKSDKSKGGKDAGAKGEPSSDSNEGQPGESGSSDSGEQDKKPLDPNNQAADAIKHSLKDLEKQKEKERQSAQDQKPQNGDNGNKDQSGNSNNGGKPDNSGQDNSENKSPQGGQGGQPKGGSKDGNPQNGNSANPQSQGKQGESGSKDGTGQKPNVGNDNAGIQGNQKPSPQQGGNDQPNGGTQPKGGQKGAEKSSAGQSTPQNSGSQGNNKSAASASPQKNGGNAGTENKPESKPAGGNKGQENQQASGGKSPKEKTPGGEQGGKQQGGNPQTAEKTPGGSDGNPNNSQVAMNGRKSEKKNSASGDSAGQEMPNSEKPNNKAKPESGNASGGSQNSQSPQEKKEQSGGSGAGGQQQPKSGNGQQPDSGGGGKPSPEGKKPGNQGDMADGQPRQMDPGKKGDSQLDSHGAPDPQVDPQRAGDKAGDAHQGLNPSDNSKSPGNSPHKSDSESQTKGDRNGGGGEGGGEHDKKTGKGAAGSSSNAEHGGAVSNEKGEDATGNKAGDAVKTTDNTGSQRKEAGTGSGEKTQPSEKQAGDDSQQPQDKTTPNGDSNQDKSASGQPGSPSSQPSGQHGTGFPTGGSSAGDQSPASQHLPEGQPEDADPAFARNQVDLALRHLKDEMSKPKSELLDRMGWTPEEAKKFVENIERLRDSANQPGNEANKKAYHEFLKDLGLRPHGTRIEGGQTRTDNLRDVHDAGLIEPPAEWAEATRQFSRSAAGQK